jgi:hypothetical protein
MPATKIKPPIAETLFRDNWPRRRKWMAVGLIFCMGNAEAIIVVFLVRLFMPMLGPANDAGILLQALLALLGMAASIYGSYIFGATWDDNNKRMHLASREDFDPYGSIDMPPPPPTVAAVAMVNPTPPDPATDPNAPPGYAQ